jgi:hypothetical protein
MRTSLVTLMLTLAMSLAGLASADIQECRVLNGKMTCEMLRADQRPPVASQARQMFLGKVTNVLDHETLQVETDGRVVRVRPVINSAWTISAAEMRLICMGKMVGVYVRQADAQIVLADVLLDNTQNLSTVLAQATRESPAAVAFREQQAKKKAHEQTAARLLTDQRTTVQADDDRWQTFLAQERAGKQAAALAEQKSAEQSRREAMEMVLAGLKQIPLPSDYQARIDVVLSRVLKDPDSRKVTYTALPWGSLVCGTVNAKNSFGGYTGAQPFVTYFTAQKEMGHFKIYTAQELNTTLAGGTDLEKEFLRACRVH